MSKEDVINYVMTTPGNPNRAVLTGMLDSIAESGGTVEVIKIGTASGGGMNYTRADAPNLSQTWEVNGGGSFDDEKTLGEILNGKKIISLAFDIPLGGNALHVKSAFVGVAVAGKTMYDIRLAQNYDEWIDQKSFTIFSDVMQTNGNFDPNGKAIDVYAICI